MHNHNVGQHNVISIRSQVLPLFAVRMCGLLFVMLQTFFFLNAYTTAESQGIADSAQRVSEKATIRVCPPDINFGETIQCSIDLPSEQDPYSFVARSGDKVLVRMSNSGNLWSGFKISDPDGIELVSCGKSSDPTAEVSTCIMPKTGTYRLLARDGFNGTRTGIYYLYLQRTHEPSNTLPIRFGQTISGTIQTPAQSDAYTFVGLSGDKVLVRMSNTQALWSGIRIFSPDGVEISGCSKSSDPTTESTSCDLPANGSYHLLIFDGFDGTLTGSYYLFLQRVNRSPGAATDIAFGTTISGTIKTPAQMNIYTFAAVGGSKVSVRMSNTQALWSGIRLLNPDGVEISGCSKSSDPTAEIASCELQTDGLYRILAYDGFDGTRTGDYFLSLGCNNPPCDGPNMPIPVALIYAVLDNNLGAEVQNWERLVNNSELGAHPGITVYLLIDGPGADDVYLYDIEHDENPHCPSFIDYTCNGRYQEGQNFQKLANEDTAFPNTLITFATQILNSVPANAPIILSLVGHGSGWSANTLPGQPSGWGSQPERIGGMLWDDTPGDGGTSRSLSTKALGYALNQIQQTSGRAIDLLYLDACSMGMVEVAYEVRKSVRYLLASPNTDWASFAYHKTLPVVNGKKAIDQIGKEWLFAEANMLRGGPNPFTFALYDLAQIDALVNAINALGNALIIETVNQKQLIGQASDQAERFESNYDGAIDNQDHYVDLYSFTTQIEQQLGANSSVGVMLDAVRNALQSFVLEWQFSNGAPWQYPEYIWQWRTATGLSIYLPIHQAPIDDPKRLLYTGDNLEWAQVTSWDEFLHEYWRINPQAANISLAADDPLPTCNSTRECDLLPTQLEPRWMVYLPTIIR